MSEVLASQILCKNTTFQMSEDYNELIHVPFSLDVVNTELTRKIAASPFVPNDEYYVEEYSYAEEQGINFYAFGNTEAEFKTYLEMFSSFET